MIALFYMSFIFNNKNYNYVLDSIILTNKEHFNPKENSHFVSVLTINKNLNLPAL
jgi:hypothetical protein